MRYILLFGLFLVSSLAIGQSIPPQYPNIMVDGKKEGEWVVWFDAKWDKTDVMDSVVYYRKIIYKKGKPDGMVNDFYRSGVKQWEGRFISDEPKEVQDGKCKYFKESGKLSSIITYDNGLKNGIYIEYNDSENVIVEGYYEDDIESGIWKYYDDKGELLKEIDLENSWEGLGYKLISLHSKGNLNEELIIAEKAVKAAITEYGINHEYYGISISVLARLYKDLEQYEKALPLHLEALDITEKTLGKNHEGYGTCLNNLAELYRTMCQYDKALPIIIEALVITEKTLGKNHEGYGTCLNNLALLYENMGQCDKALPMHLEALDNTEKTLGKNHATYGVRLNNLALLYQTTGQYNKALPLFQEALENTEKTLGKNNFIYGIRLNNLALFYETTGQYDKALPLFLEALDNTEKTLGKNHSIYSNRLNNLAGLYMTMGQYNKAIRMFLEALDNTEKTLGKNHEDYGTWLNNLAVLLRRMGQYNNALPLSLGALEITEKTLGKNHATYGVRLNNLALLYHSMEQYEKALSLYVEAIENCEKTLGKNHTSYSVGLNNLAGLYQTMDKHDKALPIYLEALENVEKTLGRNHLDYGTHLNNLALLYHTIGQYDKALPHYLVAKENIEKNLVSNFTFMDEKFKENYLKNIHYIFEVHNSFYTKYHIELPSGKSHIFDNELLMKSLILQSSANINNFINNSKDTIIVHKAQVLKALKNIIIKEETKSLSEQRKDLGDLVEKAERLEGELSRLSNQFAEFQSIGKIKTNDISKALKTNEVAVEFASFDYHDGRKWTDSIIYVALVLRQQDSIPLMVTLFEEKQLDSLLRSANLDKDVITQIYRGSSPVGSQPISKQIHNKLYNLIWKPIVPYLNKGDKVYYAPSGKLHNVSMAAIASSDTTYLSDDYELQQVSTTAKLSGEQKAKIDIDEITMYGGIAYDASDEKIKATIPISSSTNIASRNVAHDSIRGETWNYLSGTKSEVDYISSLAAKYNINTTSYTDHKATEESYKNLQGKSSPSILHIATHGFFYPIKKKSKKDLEMMQFNQEPVFTYSENPLNRSGLLFAGSNKSWQGIIPEDREDGILTAFEASNVYLPNTKLAVLSACETGLGDIKGSEGVYGMQRALKMAGVEYLLISLWKVPDAATSEYMTIFYEDLFKNKNIETAYQKAQKDMKKKYPNEPWMWGGFVLVR